MVKIGLLSDTHSYLDEKIFTHFKACDEIWHAGDIGSLDVLEKLEAFKPTRAVFGNIDGQEIRVATKEILRFTIEKMSFFLIHIGGKPYSYYPNVREALQKQSTNVFICGHSHILRVEYDKKYQMLYINPGAAGIHGFHKTKTITRFTIDNDKIKDFEVIELGLRAKQPSLP